MKKLTINSCGDCPFIELNFPCDGKREDVCGFAPLIIKDLNAIHPDCELDDC